MKINIKQIFEQALSEAELLTEAEAYMILDEGVAVINQADVAKYTDACDTIIAHLIKQAGVLANKLRVHPLSSRELELIKTIFTNTSAARSHLVFANKSTDILRAEEAIEQATKLLNKSNFKGL